MAGCGKNKNGELHLLEPEEIGIGLTSETWITSMGQDQSSNLLLACSRYEETLDLLELKKLSVEGELLQSLEQTRNGDVLFMEAARVIQNRAQNYINETMDYKSE